MMRLLISLADFPDFVPFSANIDPLLVNPHIRDAQTFDVGPLVPAATWAALETALDAVAAGFAPNEFDSADFLTAAAAAGWADTALAVLWYNGVRPLLVCESARRMLLWHGAHVTPNGLETISDIGRAPVTTAQRTELRADAASKCTHWRGKLVVGLRVYAPTTLPTCTTRPARRPGNGGLTMSAV